MRNVLLLAVLAAACPAGELTLLQQVQPDYGDMGSAFIVDQAEVQLTVTGDGVPFSVKSDLGLPDSVVRALAAWRYQPFASADKGVTVPLTVPIRRALTPALERELSVHWKHSKETSEAVKHGESLDPSSAAALLANLPPNEEPDLSRTALIVYYAKHPSPETNRQRGALVLWLIEHYPQAEILGSSYAVLNLGGPAASPEEAQKARTLWSAAIADYPGDYTVVQHAVNFLRLSDPDTAASLLMKFPRAPRQRTTVATVYASRAMGIAGIDLETGHAVLSSSLFPPSFKSIAGSSDPEFVLAAVRAITSAGRSLAAAGHLPPGYEELCGSVVAHAKQLFPGTLASCDAGEQVQTAGGEPGPTMHPDLIKKIQPVYPPQAKKRRISGVQVFKLVIGIDGHPRDLELLSGVLPLYEASRQSVLQWEFRPGSRNGQPVETQSTVEVSFALL
jgi:hypothetical protein